MTEPTKEAHAAAGNFIPTKMGQTLVIALATAFDAFAAQCVAEAVMQNKTLWAVAEWADCYMNSITEHDENQAVMQLRDALSALKEPPR